ncbi:MAG: hypothetical protein HY813_00155 [Candidatus Portnoybacteria bacterium]|nr:hypothetical protein [Candidatus Portnoybacteria bacterium]
MNALNPPELFTSIGIIIFDLWWFWLPVFLFAIFFNVWMYYIQRKYWISLKWVLLEVKPPKEIEQSPKIAEAVFAALWAIHGTVGTKIEKYLQGVTQLYVSFEVVGIGGETHFLIRVPEVFKNFVEAKIYAQYPKAEIQEIEDYVYNLPSGVLGKDWDLWGTIMQLAKPDSYPIRTYEDFVELAPKQPMIDPMAHLMEAIAKLRGGEQIWLQFVIRPTDDSWVNKGNELVGKLMGRPALQKSNLFAEEIASWARITRTALTELVTGKIVEVAPNKKEEKKQPSMMQFLSPGERGVVEMIERKMSKKTFEARIQFVYLAKKDVFAKPNVAMVMGFFNQFATVHLNSLKPNKQYTTKANYFFAAERALFKKKIMLRLCQQRPFWEKGVILNIEELASLWHFPTISVEAPMLPVVEAKKSGPPAGLPVV